MPSPRHGLVIMVLVLLAPGRVPGQGVEYVKAHYTKYEYKIKMRDGVRLFTSVYVPKEGGPHPILLSRTPYTVAPYGLDRVKDVLGPSALFGNAGYIFAYQDVRGRWMSEGEFVNMRPIVDDHASSKSVDESTDAFDTIDWLVKNLPGNNGKVGMWGISYPGFYTAAATVDAHPALVAASPQAPVTDWFIGDDWHHNGAFFLPHAFNFLANFGHPRPKPTTEGPPPFRHGTPDAYQFFLDLGPLRNADRVYFKKDVPFWNEVMEHGTYDKFWKSRNLRPHLKGTKPAVMTVGGWYDAENLFGALETYRNIEANGPKAANTLVMGPWFHGGWSRGDGDHLGHVRFDARTGEYYRQNIEFPFFEHHLKGKGDPDLPEAFVFETGRNQWRRCATWPPEGSAEAGLYLQPDGGLAFGPPAGGGDEAFDEYVSDPDKPVPFIGDIDVGMKKEYMVADQRFAARRPDVAVYRSEPLEADVTLAGPIDADLFVSTTGTDSDWVVKLIDVYPGDYSDPSPNPAEVRMGGFQQLVRGDVLRGKFRESFEEPKPFEAGRPTRVKFRLQDVYHTFRPGHRIMVQVQSSWFPLVDRNPQKLVDIYSAEEGDFRKATQRVYRSADRPSRLLVRRLTNP